MRIDRNIAAVVSARFLSRLGGTAAFFIGIWGLAAYRLHASAAGIAQVMVGLSLASMLGALISGVLIDRFGPKRVVIVAELLLIPAALLVMRAGSLAALAQSAWLIGLIQTPVYTATASFAPYIVKGKTATERVNSWIEAAGSVGFILGPAAGALISRYFATEWVFVFMATCSLAGAAVTGLVVLSAPARAASTGHPLRELREGLRVAYTSPAIRFIVLCGTGMWFVFGSFSTLEPLFYRDIAKAGVEWIGWMNTLFGVGMVAGAAALPRAPQRVVSLRGVCAVVGAVGLGAILYVGSPDLRIIGFGALTWGIVIGFAEPLLRTIIQLESPHEFVGRIASVTQLHRNAGEIVPLAFAPLMAAAFGVQPVLIGGGLILTATMIAVFAYAKRLDLESGVDAELPAAVSAEEAA